MRRKKYAEIDLLEFELFDPFQEIGHGSFLRGSQKSNLGFSDVVSAHQEHKIQCHHVVEKKEGIVADILLTQKKGLALSITHADCQAALIYDPATASIAALHAGWRGQVQGIYQEAILQMHRHFGSRPEDLFVAISPSLGPKYAEFIHYKEELPQSFWNFRVAENYFDLWAIALSQIVSAGVQKEKIQLAALCTYEDPDSFFSYRRDKKKGLAAQHTTMIGLKND